MGLKISFHRPHSPYDPPERVLNATPAPKQGPARSIDGWDLDNRHCSNQGHADQCCGEVDGQSLDSARHAYLSSVAFMDEQMGHIMSTLKATGLLENTFILYTSDH